MGILTWIVVGTIAGWVVSMIQKRDFRRDWLNFVLLGMSGSAVGGILYGLIRKPFGHGLVIEIAVAVGGAFVFLWIMQKLRRL